MCDSIYDSADFVGSPVPLQKGHWDPSSSIVPSPAQTAHLLFSGIYLALFADIKKNVSARVLAQTQLMINWRSLGLQSVKGHELSIRTDSQVTLEDWGT